MTEVLRGRHWEAGTDTFHTAPAPCNLFFPQFRLLSAGSTPNPINSKQEVFPAQWWGGAGWTQWRNLTTSPPRQTIMAQTFFNSDRTDINITLAEVQPWTGRIQFTVIYRTNYPLDRNMKSVSLAVRPARGSLNVKIK